jgi:hypothetical protein
MVSTIELLDILQKADIDEVKAKAIVRVVEQKEAGLREEIGKSLATKQDLNEGLAKLESGLTTKFYVALISAAFSHAAIVLSAVYFITKAKP